MGNKFNNKKKTVDGITFDSKKEANRYIILKTLERNGYISDLRMQVTFELVPATNRISKGKERAVKYIADFVYVENGKTVVEDVKGVRTDVYKIKKKLMLWRYGIEIKET